ncbi:CDP-alcohol phosphatidyltransferase-domain-containing protein [Phycomyces nitens]|nr:CDP-alcohol phosphatidyltransferase-domain-containing protein [Phycomyces nitens]
MTSILKSEFLDEKQLANLRLYKYAAVDRSFATKYVLRHYWDVAIRLFPMWMAPNLITLTGLMFMIINVILTVIYRPAMDAGGPSWIYFSYAAGLWLYSTFDNVDGRQARRTGTSSPLGELFDHGCDALNCSFAATLQAAGLGMGHSMGTASIYVIAMAGFYLSTAEEYHTGVLYLGYVNAPTEGVILSCIIFILSGIYGASIWQTPLGNVLSVGYGWLEEQSLAHVLVGFIGCMLVFTHAPVCFYAMYKACVAHKKPFVQTMMIENLPIVSYTAAFIFWVTSPYSTIFSAQHFILFAITTGIVFGRMASKIILAHLTKSPFPNFTVLLIPLYVGAILVNLPRLSFIDPILTPSSEYYFLVGYFVFALVAYLRWAMIVIDNFCSYLGIRCLVIPKAKTQ